MIRPHVLLSVAVSVDGHIDDRGEARFPLSNAEDFDHVDRMRAESDAVLVGAGTVRRDNPRLLVNDAGRRAARVAAGRPEHPLKVTVSRTGELDPDRAFWHCGGGKLVYTAGSGAAAVAGLPGVEVVPLGPAPLGSGPLDSVPLGPVPLGSGAGVDLGALLDDLGARGVRRLMVEGGTRVHTAFLAAGLADELRVAVAPLLIGQADAPRFVDPTAFPGGPAHRFHLEDVSRLGDVAVLRYFPKR